MRLRPWLWLPPALAHHLSLKVLKSLNLLRGAEPPVWRPFTWRGLKFPNRLGLAGGVDKDAESVQAWWTLGAGFLEIGTITPLPQPGNAPPVIARHVAREALWNRMGFPSQGMVQVRQKLERLRRPRATPLFANIGKNASTPLAEAHLDYLQVYRELAPLVDGFVINISSPNTVGLRELLKPDRLRAFLQSLMAELPSERPPILLKLSPDLENHELETVLLISSEMGMDGWVLTNTTLGAREGLPFPAEGGVSGRPLAPRSKELLKKTVAILGERRQNKLLVSVGGVMSANEVKERLDLGADLVQVYTALIFHGPWFFRHVAQVLRRTVSIRDETQAQRAVETASHGA